MSFIPFNKPYLTGKEGHYIYQAVSSGKISGDGVFTKKCHEFFEQRYGFEKVFLTTSCTDALELSALLLDLKEGDEVIMPSYTFVSTANAFALRGAKIVFCDSRPDQPNIDENEIEKLITDKTRAIVVVHYAGMACNMGRIMELAAKHNIYVIEDAAQAIDNYYLPEQGEKKALGSIGHLSAFSFHETKNIMSGEGGMLVSNDNAYTERAEIIREKGTNRAKFFRGEVDKYSWVDIGSSFLPSDIISAFLYAQLENLDDIQQQRIDLWNAYYEQLKPLDGAYIQLPVVPDYTTNNAHMFYIVCKEGEQRSDLIQHLKDHEINAVFHYQSLHKSQYYESKYGKIDRALPNSDRYTECLLRLPLYYELTKEDVTRICEVITAFFKG